MRKIFYLSPEVVFLYLLIYNTSEYQTLNMSYKFYIAVAGLILGLILFLVLGSTLFFSNLYCSNANHSCDASIWTAVGAGCGLLFVALPMIVIGTPDFLQKND